MIGAQNIGRLPVFQARLSVCISSPWSSFTLKLLAVIFSQKPQSSSVPLYDLGAVMVEAIVAIMESITATRYSLSKLDQKITATVNTKRTKGQTLHFRVTFFF